MARPTRAPADAAARQRLLTAALERFDRKGYAGTTVREIVEAAGVTKPVLYYYFGSKEGIFLELVRDATARFDRILEEAGRSEGPVRGRIERLCAESFALFKRTRPLVRILNSIYYGPAQGTPRFDVDRYHFKFQDYLKRLLREGRRRGELRFKRTEDAMWAVVGALNVATEVELCHPEMALDQRDLKRVLAIVFEGMVPPDPAPP